MEDLSATEKKIHTKENSEKQSDPNINFTLHEKETLIEKTYKELFGRKDEEKL